MRNPKDFFNPKALKRICEMDERKFAKTYRMDVTKVPQQSPDDFFAFKDNGSSILAVAHLDTVGLPHQRTAHFTETEAGLVVHSRALDDRLGAYIILDMLPKLGIEVDVLLTVGEESGRSTAQFFEAPKQYNWMIEFDRGGTDVVMYDYEDEDVIEMVLDTGAKVGDGIFSDICYLDHLDIKGFNWGVGYRDYHGPRAHAYLNDTFEMVGYFDEFYSVWSDTHLPHVPAPTYPWWSKSWSGYRFDDDPDAPDEYDLAKEYELANEAIMRDLRDL
jgi:hypothetical protein